MKRSLILYGIDGCPAGWLCVSCPSNGGVAPKAEIIQTLDGLIQRLKPDDIVAIDIPIGLPADTMTDIASRPPQSPRFRRDRSTLERRAGVWLRDFREAASRPGFTISDHLAGLAEHE